MKFLYELSDGRVKSRKIRGSGREAAMRAAASAPKGTVVIAKARKVKQVVGSTIRDQFTRVASPTKTIVCIQSARTGKVTCVDRPTARRLRSLERQVLGTARAMSALGDLGPAPATAREALAIPGLPRSNPMLYGARTNPSRRRRRFAY